VPINVGYLSRVVDTMAEQPKSSLSYGTYRIRSHASYHMGQYLTLGEQKKVIAVPWDDTSDSQLV
jgi:hypothetical protein